MTLLQIKEFLSVLLVLKLEWESLVDSQLNYADPFDGTVKTFTGYTKGIITKVNDGSVDVKMLSRTDNATGITSAIDYTEGGLNRIFCSEVF